MVVGAAFFTLIAILLAYYVWLRRKYYALSLKFPGPRGLPFVGIVHKICNVAKTLYVLPELAYKCKSKTIFFWFGPFPVVYTMEPKIAEVVLNNADCINKSLIYDSINDVIGDGLLTSRSPKWNLHRKLLNPSFNYKVLLSFFPIFNRIARELCGKLDSRVGCGEVNVNSLLLNMGMKSSLATTMGLNLEVDPNDSLLDSMERLFLMTVHRVLRPWLRSSTIFRLTSLYKPMEEARTKVIDFVHKLVVSKLNVSKEKVEDDSNNNTDSVDIKKNNNIFIEQAIKIHQNNDITLDDVVSESNLIIFAASETTATTLTSTLMFLAMYPQYQEKLFEEICTFFPDKDFVVNCEDFKNLVYLEMCINEALRVAPGIPLIARDTENDVTISEGVVVPKGTQIVIDIFNIHRSEEIWGPDAKIFNPDHFLPANLEGKHKYSYMPFSKGQRNCLGWRYAGMVLKVVLVHILRKYRFTTTFKFEDLRYMESLTLRYEKIPNLEVHRRADS